MRLASLRDGSRDGRLVVVDRDLTRCTRVPHIARSMREALDEWDRVAPRLERASEALETGATPSERFHERDCLSPLPRMHQWLDGSAYLNHVELVRRARGAAMPEGLLTDPLLYQGVPDTLPPRAPIAFPPEGAGWGIDCEGEVAIVTGDVPMGADEATAGAAIRLVMLANDVSLRTLIQPELAKGFGFVQSKPAGAFSPVAVTPDDLPGWDGAKLHGALEVTVNGAPLGRADAGRDMSFDFPRLVAHAARTRALGPGTVIGSGTVSNREDGEPARPVAEGGVGYSCIAEVRMIETIRDGGPRTPFMGDGDTVRIEMRHGTGHEMGHAGRSLFGAIEQTVRLAPVEMT